MVYFIILVYYFVIVIIIVVLCVGIGIIVLIFILLLYQNINQRFKKLLEYILNSTTPRCLLFIIYYTPA